MQDRQIISRRIPKNQPTTGLPNGSWKPPHAEDQNQHHQKQQHPRQQRRIEGHEIPLVGMSREKAIIEIILTNGSVIRGKTHGFDRYTVSIEQPENEYPLTFFKSAIESFTRVNRQVEQDFLDGNRKDWNTTIDQYEPLCVSRPKVSN